MSNSLEKFRLLTSSKKSPVLRIVVNKKTMANKGKQNFCEIYFFLVGVSMVERKSRNWFFYIIHICVVYS